MDDEASPVTLFNESVSRLLLCHPRLGRFARFPVLEQPADVAATDGWRFYAGPRFATYAPEERDGVVLHEMLHVLLNHPVRGGEIIQDQSGIFPTETLCQLVNNAADYVTNLLVMDSGELLPDDALVDHEYADMGLRQVYDILRHKHRANPPPPPWGNDIAGGDQDGKGQQQQQGAPGNDPADQQGGASSPGAGFSKDEATAIIRAITGRAAPIPVHVWLQRRLLRGTTKRNTWARQSRFGPLVPGRQRARGDHIVFCVDTSGSIDETTQHLFRRIAAGIPHAASTSILFADVCVRSRVLDIRNPDEIPAAWRHCAGGGGTFFDAALGEALALNPSHVIYLTDAIGYRDGTFGRPALSGGRPALPCATTWIVFGENNNYEYANHYHPWRGHETPVFIDAEGNVVREGAA